MPEQKEELPEIKGMMIEEVEAAKEGEEGLLQGIIRRASERLEQMRKARKEKAWLESHEGKKWKKSQDEEARLAEIENKRAEEIYAVYRLEAKRALALERYADLLLKRAKIEDDDPRLAQIMKHQEDLRTIVTNAYRGGLR
ncbi:MAG: hypothetical protein WC732_01860 [Candidatus Omnitrophota bacterium]